jgi:hypothetical protein
VRAAGLGGKGQREGWAVDEATRYAKHVDRSQSNSDTKDARLRCEVESCSENGFET